MAEANENPTNADAAGHRIVSAQVRRAPRVGVFLGLGAVLGLITAMVLTFAFDSGVSPNTGLEYSQLQVFGFLMLIFVTIGIVLGGVVAVILDRVSSRRIRSVTVDRELIRTVDEHPEG